LVLVWVPWKLLVLEFILLSGEKNGDPGKGVSYTFNFILV